MADSQLTFALVDSQPATPVEYRKSRTVEIPLMGGKVAIVDESDVEMLSGIKWQAVANRKATSERWYARGFLRKTGGRQVYMHNLLLGTKPVDHKDGNGLNNTRENLRPCTNRQNSGNGKRHNRKTPPSSRFKGVVFTKENRRIKRWKAQIGMPGTSKNLGRFLTEEEAARAYDKAAIEAFGEFARINFPEEFGKHE